MCSIGLGGLQENSRLKCLTLEAKAISHNLLLFRFMLLMPPKAGEFAYRGTGSGEVWDCDKKAV